MFHLNFYQISWISLLPQEKIGRGDDFFLREEGTSVHRLSWIYFMI